MSLVAWYKLDGNTLDSGPNSLHGTPSSITYTAGRIGQGRNTGFLTVANNPALQLVGAMSITFWIYVNSLAIRATVIDKAYGGEYTINLETNGVLRMYAGTAGGNAHTYTSTDSTPLSIGQWYHACIIRYGDGSSKWVLNAQTVSSSGPSNIYAGSPSPIAVRIGTGYTADVNAILDDVKFFNHPLSTAEINELYQAKVLHYRFNDMQEPTDNLFDLNISNRCWSSSGDICTLRTDLSSHSLRVQGTASVAGSYAYIYPLYNSAAGSHHTLSATFFNANNKELTVRMTIRDDSNGDSLAPNPFFYIQPGQTIRHSVSTTSVNAATRVTTSISVYCDGTDATVDALLTDIQLERKTLPSEFTPSSRGGTIADDSGYGHNAPLSTSTTPSWVKDSYIGLGAYNFDGNSKYADTTWGQGFNPTITPLTVCMWVKLHSTSGQKMVFSTRQVPTSDNRFYLGVTGGNWDMGIRTSAWGAGTVAANTSWNFISVTFSGSTAVMKVNMQTSRTINYSSYAFNQNARMGGHDSSFWADCLLDDVRVYYKTLTDNELNDVYRRRAALDNEGGFNNVTINETKHKPLLLDYTVWQAGQVGNVGQFGSNGDSAENHRVLGYDPWGKETVLWEARPDAVSGADGGWNMTPIPIDKSKMYRFSTWIWRNYAGSGTGYLGLNGYGTTAGVLRRDSIGTNDTNPYFFSSGAAPGANRWELWVGHVWPEGSGQGAQHPDSGRYTINGPLGSITRDFVWRPETTSARHRSYLYYCTDTGVRQQWAYPRMEIVDGTEPSIRELLAGHDSRNIDYVRSRGGTKPSTMDISATAVNFGEISEIGPGRDLISWYKLDGNPYDSGSARNNPTVVNNSGWVPGPVNFAISFDGTSGHYMNFPASIASPTAWTISSWVMKRAHTVNLYPIFWSFGLPYLAVDSSSSPFRLSYSSGPQTNLSGSTVPALNTWYNVIAVSDTDTMRIYVNGVLENTSTALCTGVGGDFDMGRHRNSDAYRINGGIDDMRIYNRAFSHTEARELYELSLSSKMMKLAPSSSMFYSRSELKETL
jgi:hypothetical protein